MNNILRLILTILIISIASYSLTGLYARNNFFHSSYYCQNDTITKKFYRHGILYIDKIVKRKIVNREIYDGKKVMYKYPVLRNNVGRPNIKLASGNNFLKKMSLDTIQFSNEFLPPMNMSVFIKGGAVFISQLADSAYIIKSTSKSDSVAKFYIEVSDNYEEIQNRDGFILDSLIIPIK